MFAAYLFTFSKKLQHFKNKILVGLRKFFEILTSQTRYCDVYRGLRQISTGLRQPDLRRKCDFFQCLVTSKANIVATW